MNTTNTNKNSMPTIDDIAYNLKKLDDISNSMMADIRNRNIILENSINDLKKNKKMVEK